MYTESNLSFLTGTFPEKIKLARIFPVYRNGQKDIVTNYRQISQLSKILGKLFVKTIDSFVAKIKSLNDK